MTENIKMNIVKSLGIVAKNDKGYTKEAISFIGTHMPTLTKLTAQLTMTDEYIKELEKSKGKLEEAIASRDLTIGDMEEEIFALEYKVSQLNNSQRKAQELLDRIPTDVMESITKKQERKGIYQENSDSLASVCNTDSLSLPYVHSSYRS